MIAVLVRGGGPDGDSGPGRRTARWLFARHTSSAPAVFLIEAAVPAVDDAPVGMPVPAGAICCRDYFPVARFTRPPTDALSMVEAVAAIVFARADRLVA